MKFAPFPIAVAAALAACSSPEDLEREMGQEVAAEAEAGDATASAEATSAVAVDLDRTSEDYEFGYSWPREAARHEALVARLRAEAETAEAELAATAAEERKLAEEGDFPFRQHAFDKDWKVVADLPDWLSLSATIYTYTGGAHPNAGFDSLLWDKRAGRAMSPLDLFRSRGNFERAVRTRFCDALNAERAQRRGADIPEVSDDPFEQCPRLNELTVLLGSSNSRTFDRIGLIAAPYIAGPYAEGAYEITLRVDTSVLDAAKPEHVRLFALGR